MGYRVTEEKSSPSVNMLLVILWSETRFSFLLNSQRRPPRRLRSKKRKRGSRRMAFISTFSCPPFAWRVCSQASRVTPPKNLINQNFFDIVTLVLGFMFLCQCTKYFTVSVQIKLQSSIRNKKLNKLINLPICNCLMGRCFHIWIRKGFVELSLWVC